MLNVYSNSARRLILLAVNVFMSNSSISKYYKEMILSYVR